MTLLRKSLLIFVIWLHLRYVQCFFVLRNLKTGSRIGTSSFRYGSTFSVKAETNLSLECPRRTLLYEFPKEIQRYFERAQSGVMGDLIECVPSSTYGNQANTKLSKTFLAGNLIFLILDWIQKFKKGYIRGIREVQTVCHFADVATIASLIFAVPPLFRLFHKLGRMVVGPTNNYNYESSKTRSVSRFIKNFGITSGALYIIELFSEFVDGVVNHNISLGNDLVLKASFFSSAPKFVAFTVYGFWFVRCLSLWKSKLIGDLVHSKNLFENRDRKVLVLLCDRTVTTIIYGCFIALLIDISPLKLSNVLRSVLTLGGVSSFIVGLSLQTPAKQIIAGLLILLSGKFHSEEKILFNGASAKVKKIGWQSTILQGSDLVPYSVPNESILSGKVSNLSRVRSIHEEISIVLDICDIHRVQEIMREIKAEVENSCGDDFDKDKKHPIRIVWKEIGKGYLNIVLKCQYIKRSSEETLASPREKTFLAIARAIKKTNATLKK